MTTLAISVAPTPALVTADRAAILELCTEAYAEDFAPYLRDVGPGVHLLAHVGGALVGHAMWVDRPLRPAGRAPLATAYVEAVATRPSHQRRGVATAIMSRLAEEIRGHALGALSPSDEGFYLRLGWELWRGPLAIERDGTLEPTPDETLMVLRLPGTPPDLDLAAPLSAPWRPGEVW